MKGVPWTQPTGLPQRPTTPRGILHPVFVFPGHLICGWTHFSLPHTHPLVHGNGNGNGKQGNEREVGWGGWLIMMVVIRGQREAQHSVLRSGTLVLCKGGVGTRRDV